MIQVTHRTLMPGVSLTAVHTHKFKTSMMAITLLAPLEEQTAAENALLPMVLRRGTQSYPDLEKMSAALDELYGGSITPLVRKKGETQCVGFVGSFLDDAFLPGGTTVLEPAADLMGELLLRPALEQGHFVSDYVEGERSNLIDQIRAQINEKRQYSLIRLSQLMCRGEAYGVDKLGDETHALAATEGGLWKRYQDLLHSAPICLYYCGSAPLERVEEAFQHALAGLPCGQGRTRPACSIVAGPSQDTPRIFEDRMEVTQGKLALGFRTGGISVSSPQFPALLVFNAVYGGTTTSKLFMNVREKLSLCYFASSMLERNKGLMMVSSGIEFPQYEKAKDEILAQLEACRRGEIDAQELEGARRSVVSALQTTLDVQGRLEDFWMGQAAAGLTEGPAELAARVEKVPLEQVVEVAAGVQLDAVYFLNGKEGV
jgi:predicted Zn-dependent peptidase